MASLPNAINGCLGLSWLPNCLYDAASPNISLIGMGDIFTVAAILLAFVQARDPIVRFRLRVWGLEVLLFVLPASAIGFLFIGKICQLVAPGVSPLFSFPIFWELLAATCLLGTLILVSYSLMGHAEFSKRNALRFFHACAAIIASGDPKAIGQLANEAALSAKPLIAAANEYNESQAYWAAKNNKEYAIPKHAECALTIFRLWSDPLFCEALATRAPATTYRLVDEIIKQNAFRLQAYSFFQGLFMQLFFQPSSIFIREKDYVGLGHFKSFTNLAFGNYEFIRSRLYPLDAASFGENTTESVIKKYGEALHVAMEACVSDALDPYPGQIASGAEKLSNLAGSACNSLSKINDDEIYSCVAGRQTRAICAAIEKLVKKFYEKSAFDPKDWPFNSTQKTYEDRSPYAMIADIAFDLIEQLSWAKKNEEAYRVGFLEVWQATYEARGIADPDGKMQAQIEAIVVRLEKRIFDKLNEFFLEGLGPAILRPLLVLHGFNGWKIDERTDDFIKRLREFLIENFAGAVAKHPEKILSMLPSDIRWDGGAGALIAKNWSGEISLPVKVNGKRASS